MNSPPPQLRKPNQHHVAWLLRRVWDRLNRENQHFMGVIVGEEGSGKSHTALKIARTVDPTFTADRVIFDVADLLKRIKDHDHEPGQFFILDEAGVQLGRRTWQERGQVLANQALQLIRNHNLGLLFTLPRLSELDSMTQGRLQAFLEIVEKEPDEYVGVKWKWLDPDRSDSTGTIYKKYPRRRQNGQVKRITQVQFSPPAEALIAPYEEQKREFQADFYEETIAELEGHDGSDDEQQEDEEPTLEEIADEVANNGVAALVSRHGQTKRPYVSLDLLRAKEDLSRNDAKAVKELLEQRLGDEELDELAKTNNTPASAD